MESVNSSDILNKSSVIVQNNSANITLEALTLTEAGHYKLNVSIDNGVSLLAETVRLSVKAPKQGEYAHAWYLCMYLMMS